MRPLPIIQPPPPPPAAFSIQEPLDLPPANFKVQTCSLGPQHTGTPPPLVLMCSLCNHTGPQVRKRAVGIRLKYLLISWSFVDKNSSYQLVS